MSVVLADGFEAVVDVVLAPLVFLPFPFTPLLLLYFLWLPCLLSVVGLALVVLGFLALRWNECGLCDAGELNVD